MAPPVPCPPHPHGAARRPPEYSPSRLTRPGRARPLVSALLVLLVPLVTPVPLVRAVDEARARGAVFPPLLNAALRADVSVTPASNVCGATRDEQFCKSTADPNTLTSCWRETCTFKCPNKTDHYHELVFNRVEQGAWGACVTKHFDELAPAAPAAQVQSYRVRFQGPDGNGTCSIDIPPEWMAVLFLQVVRSVTLAMWVRPLNTTTDSTLFVITTTDSRSVLRLGMTSSLQLYVTSHNQPLTTRPQWRVPLNTWTHLVLRIRDDTVSFSLNGNYVSPAAYGVAFLAVKQASKYRIGQSFKERDNFRGDIQDFRIYVKSLSNREVTEIYSGVLPATRIESNCRCPDANPRLKPSDPTYCVPNDGRGRPPSELYRLDRHSYPLQFLNDGKTDTAWVGQVGVTQTTVTVQLAEQYEVMSVQLIFYSSLPDKVTIERRQNKTKAWTPWQYFAHDCPAKFSLPTNGRISTAHAVNCRPMVTGSADPPASAGRVVFDVLAGRPGHNGTSFTYSLRQFVQADAVRVLLHGVPFSGLPNKQYHGLYEVIVNARCDCHGHGSACNTSGPEYVCACVPESYTKGRTCDQCVEGTYRDTTKTDYSPRVCRPCDCDSVGTVTGGGACQSTGGQCRCKKNVGRRRCDTCLPGFHGLDPAEQDGCRACICDSQGTQQGSNICDVTSGQCPCKENVGGDQCERCKAGFYSLDAARPQGCRGCGCDPVGVQDGDITCNQTTGQCRCRPGVTGTKCELCSPGLYRTNNTRGDACRPCECHLAGAEGTSCDVITGQCSCQPNVIGRICNRCKPGFYALSQADMRSNGCAERCACSENGTVSGDGACAMRGGQCDCKPNTAGRQCDVCREGAYGFHTSPARGCRSCDCDTRGSVGGSQNCSVTTGQCPCKTNVQSRRCDMCKDDTFKLEAASPAGCRSCGCYGPGTQPGVSCHTDTGHCACVQDGGDPSVTNFKCEPYLTAMVPTFGPESGGTLVTLRGGFLMDAANTLLKVGSLKCPITSTEGNQTTIECVTQALSGISDPLEKKGIKMDVTMTISSLEVTSPYKFTYLDDPTINAVTPQQTFLQGGLNLTVSGKHLTSVYRPLMQVTMEGLSSSTLFHSVCVVITPGVMNCPTPNITVPDEMLADVSARRRRHAGAHTQTDDVISSDGRFVRSSHKRLRRAAGDPGKVNRPSLKFFLGFILDGVTIYRDLRQSDIPQFAVLNVYLNPLIERFDSDQGVLVYRPYWPVSDDYISIKGKRLDFAATDEDYMVEIGMGHCEDLELSHNLLACRPPRSQPSPNAAHGLGPSLPAVVVTVGNIRVHVGWLDYEHTFWENASFRYGVVGGVAGLVLLAVLICLCCCCRRKAGEKPHPHLELNGKGGGNNAYISAYNNSQTSYMTPTTELLTLLPERLQQRVESALIDYKRMELGQLIGQGHFGRIYLGRLMTEDHTSQMPIAIKTLREYHVVPRDVAYFLDEATIMKDLKHEHVLHLLGVVIENNRAYVLLPYMENGDLKTFIANEDNLLTVGELIHFGQQVADGMCYLSDQRFVHRDLAARNCMVDRNMIVKIADFGLSRELYESDYYVEGEASRPLPVKWMSYESLERGMFTTLSDVWSFGVLLWELMTRGCTPYPDVDCFDMKLYISRANRMDKPDFAPDELYGLMLLCWQKEPHSRPAFVEIHTRLGEILDGQNGTNTMRNRHERQVRPLSFGGGHSNLGFSAEITRELEY